MSSKLHWIIILPASLALICGCGPKVGSEAWLISKAKKAIVESLSDPDSARFGEVHGFPRQQFACGEVNARNRMGGYAGMTPFIVDFLPGQVEVLSGDCGPSCYFKNWVPFMATMPSGSVSCDRPVSDAKLRCAEYAAIATACGAEGLEGYCEAEWLKARAEACSASHNHPA